MRINKYIAQAGVASRRKADELIENGNVRVNGQVIRHPGLDVAPDDRVEVNGRQVLPVTKQVYIMLNKPKGFITTVKDEKGRPTVMDLVTDVQERVFPIGRLDGNSTGLLSMTNDGELANKLAHPGHKIGKTYRAWVAGVVSPQKLAILRKGVNIGDYITAPAQVTVLKQTERSATVEITIHEGKNHQVRRMFQAVGCPVQELKRIAVGDLYLARLKEGHYRKLTREEIDYLKNC